MKPTYGNKTSMSALLGASSHGLEEREKTDWYATPPEATEMLLREEKFRREILEPACGGGHISKVLEKAGHEVASFDLFDHGYGKRRDAFALESWEGDVVTNPPFAVADAFVRHVLTVMRVNAKAAFFLRLGFLVGAKRRLLFQDFPLCRLLVFGNRVPCPKRGDFSGPEKKGIDYAWFIWIKGYDGFAALRLIYRKQ